ncbi:TPA: hypothetical protein L4R01_005279 [Pseudomonas aeruginosa]|nr:hypothetical protein [Pseudomonas aeruginosa]ALY33864.1 hypothetical protein HW10_01730 [Pseudomonas aeruginosa]EKU7685631.1 hypothetical protein [Pseudomonas aeruginosa]EYU03488.1 hypothetical protein PA99_0803 [Pseudomonas aeruginosa PA99]MBG5567902.1 hypothetical protein [Pseudomonas aeruginosa]MBH3675850.1 hypothetical protein [Pseudomonas aeruginosa]
MYLPLLFHRLKRVDAKAKFVLIAFIQRYGGRGAVPASSLRRANDLGLPQRELGRELAQLVREGYLLEEAVTGQQAGRPNRTYSISSHVMELVLRSDKRTTAHVDLIKHVIEGPDVLAIRPNDNGAQSGPRLVWIDGKAVPKRSNRLSLSNRLLLAVLLAHSDDFGIVRDLGNVDLCSLVGLEATSLKQRIRKLIDLGFIRRHVPGIASSVFSKKLKSIYFLNLNHPQLGGGESNLVLIHQSDIRSGDGRDEYVRGIVGDIRGGGQLGCRTPSAVISLLTHAPMAVFSQLELKLCEWALEHLASGQIDAQNVSTALHHEIDGFFRAVDVPVPASPDETLRERTQRVSLIEAAHGSRNDVVNHFCYLTRLLADECWERYAAGGKIPFSCEDLVLIPTHLPLERRCFVFVVRKGAVGDFQQHCVMTESQGELSLIGVRLETEIAPELRFESGLQVRAACEPITQPQG